MLGQMHGNPVWGGDGAQGRAQPPQPAHGASFVGDQVLLLVDCQGHPRRTLASHGNCYLGTLRKQVRALCSPNIAHCSVPDTPIQHFCIGLCSAGETLWGTVVNRTFGYALDGSALRCKAWMLLEQYC